MNAAIMPTALPAWDFLRQAREQARLGQSLLISGGRGLGKATLVDALVAALLCDQDSGLDACGHCRSCHLLVVGNHPDLLRVMPEEEGKSILVDAIRAAGQFLQHTPQVAARRVLAIAPAEAMLPAAANALLKTLEEPGPRAQIILLSHQASRLLPTIRSRCQHIVLRPLPEPELAAWLGQQQAISASAASEVARLSFGRPQRALRWLSHDLLDKRRSWLGAFLGLPGHDPAAALKLAGQWAKDGDLDELLMAVHGVMMDLLRLHLGLTEGVLNADFAEPMQSINFDADALLSLEMAWRQASLAKRQNLNLPLLLESLLLDWQNTKSGLKIQRG